MEFSTKAIHSGQEPDPATGSTVTPLYLTSVFTYEELGKTKGYDYGRHGNPTRTAMERSGVGSCSSCSCPSPSIATRRCGREKGASPY